GRASRRGWGSPTARAAHLVPPPGSLAGFTRRVHSPGSLAGNEGDREPNRPGVPAVGQPGRRAGRTWLAEPAGEHGEGLAHVGPRHVVAKAVMDSAAETEVRRPAARRYVESRTAHGQRVRPR